MITPSGSHGYVISTEALRVCELRRKTALRTSGDTMSNRLTGHYWTGSTSWLFIHVVDVVVVWIRTT